VTTHRLLQSTTPAGVVPNSVDRSTQLGTNSWVGLFQARRHLPGQPCPTSTPTWTPVRHPPSWGQRRTLLCCQVHPPGSPSPLPAGYSSPRPRKWHSAVSSTSQPGSTLQAMGRQGTREPLFCWRTRPSEPPSLQFFRPTRACSYSSPRPRYLLFPLLSVWSV
jgi:hypothetical protein